MVGGWRGLEGPEEGAHSSVAGGWGRDVAGTGTGKTWVVYYSLGSAETFFLSAQEFIETTFEYSPKPHFRNTQNGK